MTRANSVEIGGRDSRTTSSIACRNDEPARSAFASSVIVSGNCLLNALSRPFLRRFSQKRGRKNPTNPPIRRASGFPNVGKMTDKATMISGMPTIEAPQIARYSDGLRRRSARASSRDRLAPKSRPSTTLLSWASAWLWASMSEIGPWPELFAASAFGVEA
jgi:hypothetical protein